jgi:peptide/nickel transport system substrate-binding protein
MDGRIIPDAGRIMLRILTCITAAAAIVTAAACGSSSRGATSGDAAHVLTIATPADADALIPPLVASTQGKQAVDLLFDMLAQPVSPMQTVGDRGFRPQLASAWQWSEDSLSIAFTINAGARWHDGVPVRAHDVAFSHALYVDPQVASPQASAFDGIDSVTVRDSATAVVWWSRRHPEQFFQIAYNLAVMPAHLLDSLPRTALAQSAFARHPIGSGRYRFEQWSPRQMLVFTADSVNYRGRPQYARVIWSIASDPNAAALRVLAGEADVLESVRGDAYPRAKAASHLQTISYGSLDYAFLAFNLERRAGAARGFTDRALRVALTRAINRPAVVGNALDSLGQVALGPFTRADPTVDTTMPQLVYDTAAAARTLDSLGWKFDAATGMRRMGGRALQFDVLVPSSSATRQRIAVLMQAQFKAVGVQMDVTPVEPAVFFARLQKGDFDAALNMWRADPSPRALRQVWGSPRGSDVGGNFGRYRNPRFDALLDSAARTFDATRSQSLFRSAYQQIVDDAPAIWMYEPKNIAVINRRVVPVALRADAWWANIADWRPRRATVATREP